MTEEESRPLLQFLFQHQVRPELTCRFSWEVGSLALWDNRCAQHNPVNDYHGHTLVMHRITLQGYRLRSARPGRADGDSARDQRAGELDRKGVVRGNSGKDVV